MSEELNAVEVFQSRRFEKALGKLPLALLEVVEDQIDQIIENPYLGELKKGDLSYLRVHKFSLNRQQVLLGYSWKEERLQLFLLALSSHENFYDEQKRAREADLKLIRR